MKIKIKWSPAFGGCLGTAIGTLGASLGGKASCSFWVLEAIIFSIFLIGGLVHGRLLWRRAQELKEKWEEFDRIVSTSDAERQEFYDGLDSMTMEELGRNK